jgi:hypothetical protein
MAPALGPPPVNVERLRLIQDLISRFAGNSFLLKGWTVTLVAGLSAFSRAGSDRSFAWIAVFVVVTFGLMDAYYLALERRYRRLYDEASSQLDDSWSLTAGAPTLKEVLIALRSPPIWMLHGSALLVATVVSMLP